MNPFDQRGQVVGVQHNAGAPRLRPAEAAQEEWQVLRALADAARLVVDEDRWVNQVADYRFRVMGPRDLDLSTLRKAIAAVDAHDAG